ncbi:MAG: hypothetical protein GY785_05160 [Gammaproteobacteria bacterium]|nr:hypothetical protein [Gammaproteobacteria bacterium]
MMTKTALAIIGLILVAVTSQSALADAYVGQFVGQLNGDEYRLSIEPGAGNRCEGELYVAGMRLALGARYVFRPLRDR